MKLVQQKRALLVVLAAVALLAVVWSYTLFFSTTHQTLDQRVQDVASQLKCPVCQAESVADSPSTLAQQMRAIIRHKLQAGQSEQEIIQYFVNSFGQQIVWSPPWQGFSLLAWLVPIALILAGALLLFIVLRNWALQSAPVFAPKSVGARFTVPTETNQDDLTRYPTQSVGARFIVPTGSGEETNQDDLTRYHIQLEQELAEDDILFRPYRKEA
ncbi:MAG: cytochrome c-type biogenesis protein CcmH [Chloroflexi bacterium]|nr:cytochrome c-type biogenesis protein CcmH [Chloroflexota bacterium]